MSRSRQPKRRKGNTHTTPHDGRRRMASSTSILSINLAGAVQVVCVGEHNDGAARKRFVLIMQNTQGSSLQTSPWTQKRNRSMSSSSEACGNRRAERETEEAHQMPRRSTTAATSAWVGCRFPSLVQDKTHAERHRPRALLRRLSGCVACMCKGRAFAS